MGLDSFWVHPDDTEETRVTHPEFAPDLNLVGGIFSEHGAGSFRGKVYAPFIEDVTGESLYQEEIYNATVSNMAHYLSNYDVTKSNMHEQYGIYEHEVADLQRMFRAYADAGFELHGWW